MAERPRISGEPVGKPLTAEQRARWREGGAGKWTVVSRPGIERIVLALNELEDSYLHYRERVGLRPVHAAARALNYELAGRETLVHTVAETLGLSRYVFTYAGEATERWWRGGKHTIVIDRLTDGWRFRWRTSKRALNFSYHGAGR